MIVVYVKAIEICLFHISYFWIFVLVSFFYIFFDFVFLFFKWLQNLPELKCERLVCSFSGSESSGLLRESPISGLGHVSMAASSAIFNWMLLAFVWIVIRFIFGLYCDCFALALALALAFSLAFSVFFCFSFRLPWAWGVDSYCLLLAKEALVLVRALVKANERSIDLDRCLI